MSANFSTGLKQPLTFCWPAKMLIGEHDALARARGPRAGREARDALAEPSRPAASPVANTPTALLRSSPFNTRLDSGEVGSLGCTMFRLNTCVPPGPRAISVAVKLRSGWRNRMLRGT